MNVNYKAKDYIPHYATGGSCAIDLRASLLTKSVEVGQIPIMIGTDVFIEIPTGHAGLVFIRSGLAASGLYLVNGVGLIDSDYRGEIKLLLQCLYGAITIDNGQRIAQFMLIPFVKMELNLVHELGNTIRGDGGFGSTGI